MKYKIAYLTTHPIQYQVPLFRKISQSPHIELTVYFCSRHGIEERLDKEFGKVFKWDPPLLSGYKYKFLKNLIKDEVSFLGLINLSIIKEVLKNNFDLIITSGWNNITYFLCFLTFILSKKNFALRADSNIFSDNVEGLKKTLKYIFLKNLFKFAKVILAIGKANKEFYKKYEVPDKKIFLTPYSVDNDFFREKAKYLKPEKKK